MRQALLLSVFLLIAGCSSIDSSFKPYLFSADISPDGDRILLRYVLNPERTKSAIYEYNIDSNTFRQILKNTPYYFIVPTYNPTNSSHFFAIAECYTHNKCIGDWSGSRLVDVDIAKQSLTYLSPGYDREKWPFGWTWINYDPKQNQLYGNVKEMITYEKRAYAPVGSAKFVELDQNTLTISQIMPTIKSPLYFTVVRSVFSYDQETLFLTAEYPRADIKTQAPFSPFSEEIQARRYLGISYKASTTAKLYALNTKTGVVRPISLGEPEDAPIYGAIPIPGTSDFYTLAFNRVHPTSALGPDGRYDFPKFNVEVFRVSSGTMTQLTDLRLTLSMLRVARRSGHLMTMIRNRSSAWNQPGPYLNKLLLFDATLTNVREIDLRDVVPR